MRIAVTYADGQIFQHFGRTEEFKIYDVEDGKVCGMAVMPTNGIGHGALAGILEELNVEVLICGGIGMGARIALDDVDIQICSGVSGDADDAVRAYLAGTLNAGSEETCDHHHHDHDHEHGCGCGCGHHHDHHDHEEHEHHHHEHGHDCGCGHDHHDHEHHHEDGHACCHHE